MDNLKERLESLGYHGDALDRVLGELEAKYAEKKPGLWENIRRKRERIKAGSGERMRKPGEKGAPSAQDLKDADTDEKD